MTTSMTTSSLAIMEETFETNVNDLGDDEWLTVMSYLTIMERISVSRVCRRWKCLSDASLKSVAVIDADTCHANSTRDLSNLAMTLIIRKCCNAKHINLNGLSLFDGQHRSDNHTDHDILRSIADNCHQLQTIAFGSFVMSDGFADIANNCKQIASLSSSTIDDSALRFIIDSPVLECLNISYNHNIVGHDFHKFGANFRELYINGCNRINEESIKRLCEGNGKLLIKLAIDVNSRSELSLVCSHLHNLTELRLSLGCHIHDFSQMSSLKHLKVIIVTIKEPFFNLISFDNFIQSFNGKNLLQIELYLALGFTFHINDESLELLRKCCPNIEKLVLRGVSSITDAGMYAISQLKSLKHLDLMNCCQIGDGVDIVITSCPALRQLILHNCFRVELPVLDAFIEKCNTNANQLFTLDVIGSCIANHMNREAPPNMSLLLDYDDCKYGCDHRMIGDFDSDSDGINSFYGFDDFELQEYDSYVDDSEDNEEEYYHYQE